MEFRLRSANHATEEVAAANYPQIRSFNVIQEMGHTPKTDLKGKWEVCSPASASDFSAVGYFFARELYQKLNIPIGFINSSWGGTDIETWMSMEVIEHFPKYEKSLARMRSSEFEEYIKHSDKVKKEFGDYKREQMQKETKSAKESAYRELLKSVGISEKRIDSVLKVTDLSSVELEDGKIKNADDLKKSIKEEWADFVVTTKQKGADTKDPPANNGGAMSRDDIFKIRDASERQAAIAANLNLFGKEE